MVLRDVVSAGARPALEMTIRYAGERQRLLAHNIANIDTPGFQPRDVPPESFRRVLGEAVEARRARGGASGALPWRETREIRRSVGGGLRLVPRTPSGNVLFHDQNDRDLERMMQSLAENTMAYRTAVDLLKARSETMRVAISQRV